MSVSSSCFLNPVALRAIDGHDVLFQTGFWGEFKACFAWSPMAFLLNGRTPMLAMTRRLPGGLSLCYVPHGPLATTRANWNEYYLEAVARALVPHLPRGCLFVRFDLPWGVTGEGVCAAPLERPFCRAPMDIQPPSTVVIDLQPTEEMILAQMRSKTRYNVRLAQKHGVSVVEGGQEELAAWYALYQETAERDRIAIHSFAYYRKLFELANGSTPETRPAETDRTPTGGSSTTAWWDIDRPPREPPRWRPDVRLLMARRDGELLAGIVVALHHSHATYLFGASSNQNRNLMATYLLQWEAMRLAKQEGCVQYDLFGIPFRDDPTDPMFGLYRFKTGFGGTIVNRPGSWDYPLLSAGYALYRRAESARRWYYKSFKKGHGAAQPA